MSNKKMHQINAVLYQWWWRNKGAEKENLNTPERERKPQLFLAYGSLLCFYLEVKMSLGSQAFYIFITCGWPLNWSGQYAGALDCTSRTAHSRSQCWTSGGKISFPDSSPQEAKITTFPTSSPPTAPTSLLLTLFWLGFLFNHITFWHGFSFMYEMYYLSSVSPITLSAPWARYPCPFI